MNDYETRSVQTRDIVVSSSKAAPLIRGRAIVYNSLSEDLGGFREVFKPGSVRLADDLLILQGHDTNRVLGRTSAGTAHVKDDGLGIVFEADPPATTWASDLMVSMSRNDVRQCSFRFRCIRDDYHYDSRLQTVVRTVHEAEVSELSIVTLPAYTATESTVV